MSHLDLIVIGCFGGVLGISAMSWWLALKEHRIITPMLLNNTILIGVLIIAGLVMRSSAFLWMAATLFFAGIVGPTTAYNRQYERDRARSQK